MRDAGDFEGVWHLERIIADVGARRIVGRFRGQATFAPRGRESLDYEENGQLRLSQGGSCAATRRYFWHFEGPILRVEFDDGRPFWQVALSGGLGSPHLCGSDLYEARLTLGNWPRWRLAWRVRGPRKDLVIASAFRRMDEAR